MIPEEIVLKYFPFLVEIELKRKFSENCIFKEIPAQSVLLREDDTIHYLPLVLKGSLKVTRKDKQGRDILLYYISQGESCIASYAAALFREQSKVSAFAEEACEIVLLPVNQIEEWARAFPSWNLFVVKLYYRRFEELLDAFNSLTFQKVDERLADHLKRKAVVNDSAEISTTHQQLADEIGTAREVVSRLLKVWETEGKLTISRGLIKINPSL